MGPAIGCNVFDHPAYQAIIIPRARRNAPVAWQPPHAPTLLAPIPSPTRFDINPLADRLSAIDVTRCQMGHRQVYLDITHCNAACFPHASRLYSDRCVTFCTVSLLIIWHIASFGAAVGSPPRGLCGLHIATGTVPASRLAVLASATRVQEREQKGRSHETDQGAAESGARCDGEGVMTPLHHVNVRKTVGVGLNA